MGLPYRYEIIQDIIVSDGSVSPNYKLWFDGKTLSIRFLKFVFPILWVFPAQSFEKS